MLLLALLAAAFAAPRTVHLVTTGATGGLGAGAGTLSIPDDLGDEMVDLRPMHGVLAHGPAILFGGRGRVDALVALRQAPPDCVATGRGRLAVRPHAMVLTTARGASGARPVTLWRCTTSGVQGLLVLPDGEHVPADWSGFEYRPALRVAHRVGDTVELAWVVGTPTSDPARQVTAIQHALAEHEGALWVDAGDFVDGASAVEDGALSLHRPHAWSLLERLGPAALVPGRQELAGGAARFVEEAGTLPYVTTNWIADDGPPPFPRSRVVHGQDGVRVAFLGIIGGPVAGVAVAEPAAAVEAELAVLPEVDLVVVLVSGDPSAVADVQSVDGVDVVVGGAGQRLERIQQVSVQVDPRGIGGPAPITIPVQGVVSVDVTLEGGPQRATWSRRPISAKQQPDPGVLDQINAVRDVAYIDRDEILLPAPGSDPARTLSPSTWATLVCQAVRENVDAQVALLPALPRGGGATGPLTELQVADRLTMLDRLEVHLVAGERLQRLLDAARGVVPMICGATLGASAAVLDGRGIDPLRRYRVVTTDRLGSASLPGMGDRVAGDRRTLRRAVLDVLRTQRARGQDPVLTLAARDPTTLTPQWLVRVNRAAGSLSQFQGIDDPEGIYAGIPETLATSPSSLTVATDVDVALEYGSRRVAWDVRGRLLWSELNIRGDDAVEQADDLRLSTSASLPAAAVRVASRWIPYVELLLDSEVTPTWADVALGLRNPRQADLSLTAGMSTSAGILTRARVGVLALRDLANPDKGLEPGARIELATTVPVTEGVAWTTRGEGFLFADSPGHDASDLRFKALVDTRLRLQVARYLAAAPFAQAFAFAGRVPETSQPRVVFTLGASIDLIGAFSLGRAPAPRRTRPPD